MDELTTEDPIALFRRWLSDAEAGEPNDPTAMCLATVDENGNPDARMVLLKGVDAQGFVFYTNLGSRKADELARRPQAALCFHWKSLRRQIRVGGPVERASAAEADAYFASRARESQLGAWASDQSRPLASRAMLETRFQEVSDRFGTNPIPRPEFWGGFRLVPDWIEFWIDRPHRLHERIRFDRAPEGWRTVRLFP